MKLKDILVEGDSLGLMIAKMQQKQTARDWNKLSTKEKLAQLKKEREDADKRRKEYFGDETVEEVKDKRPSYVVTTKDKPKKVKPSTGGSSPHPYQGKLVGATEAEEPNTNTSSREKLNRSLVAQGHRVEKDRKKAAKRGEVKHKGQIEEGPLAKVAGAVALIASIWGVNDNLAQQAYDHSPQLQKLTAYLEVAKEHNDTRMIHQLETRIENHKMRLSLGKGDIMGKDGKPAKIVYDKEAEDGGSIASKIGWGESKKKITKSNDPCWNGYHMVGTKTKDGKEVPNCVPGKKG